MNNNSKIGIVLVILLACFLGVQFYLGSVVKERLDNWLSDHDELEVSYQDVSFRLLDMSVHIEGISLEDIELNIDELVIYDIDQGDSDHPRYLDVGVKTVIDGDEDFLEGSEDSYQLEGRFSYRLNEDDILSVDLKAEVDGLGKLTLHTGSKEIDDFDDFADQFSANPSSAKQVLSLMKDLEATFQDDGILIRTVAKDLDSEFYDIFEDFEQRFSFTLDDDDIVKLEAKTQFGSLGMYSFELETGRRGFESMLKGQSTQAALQAVLKSAQVDITDDGLIRRIYPLLQEEFDLEDYDEQVSELIQEIESEDLEDDNMKEAMNAITSFLRDPEEIHFSINPDQPIGVIQIVVLKNEPMKLVELMNFKASLEKE